MKPLYDKLPDEFSKQVLAGSLRVIQDVDNTIRLNLFAAGIRELFGHILHSFAPDDEVRACTWFVQALDTNKVTRRQRVTYATQGGFSDAYVESLWVDVEELHDAALKSIDALNKATHVRPGRIELDQAVIEGFVEEALDALDGLLESFQTCQDSVRTALQDHVYDAIMMAFVSETFDDIDLLAGKGYEVNPFIEETEFIIETISSTRIHVKFTGVAPVTLHYGSRDDAAQIEHDFPFWMKFEAPVEHPTELQLIDYFVDNRGWFE